MTTHKAFRVVHDSIGLLQKYATPYDFRRCLLRRLERIEEDPTSFAEVTCVAAGLLLGMKRFSSSQYIREAKAYWQEHARLAAPPAPQWQQVSNSPERFRHCVLVDVRAADAYGLEVHLVGMHEDTKLRIRAVIEGDGPRAYLIVEELVDPEEGE